jgi:T5orf172 domain
MERNIESGYVYVLLNPSLPDCVKIGKTTREPATRAAELSSATGVPTPFLVAYEAYFSNCHLAETYIHTLLEAEGFRLSANREFFKIPASRAINAVIHAQSKFGTIEAEDDHGSENNVKSNSSTDTEKQPWEGVLEEAEDYLYGNGDKLEDENKAIELLKIAAKLGSESAYVKLGEIYGGVKGLEWVRNGADKGFAECWLSLANIYSGDQIYFREIPLSKGNSTKCFRNFLSLVDVPNYDSRKLFFAFKKYLENIQRPFEQADVETLAVFLPKFISGIEAISEENERSQKLQQLHQLCEEYITS